MAANAKFFINEEGRWIKKKKGKIWVKRKVQADKRESSQWLAEKSGVPTEKAC
jgi:hypothetical protein